MKEELRSGEIDKVKKRHGFFTAWLVFMSAIYFAFGTFAFVQVGTSILTGWAFWEVLGGLVTVTALFKWKKWVFCGLQLAGFVANLLNDIGIGRSLYGLINIPLLYGVFNIGKEKEGWNQLE